MAISKSDITKALKTAKAHHMGGGIYLDVRSATSASWVFKFTFGGKADQVGLGSLAKLDGDAAEGLRLWCVAELAANPARNPRVTRANAKLDAKRAAFAPKGLTVYQTAEAHVAKIAKDLRPEGRAAWVRSLHSDFIGDVANMDPAKVTDLDVIPLMNRLYAKTPVMAKDVRQRLFKVLTFSCRKIPGWSNPVSWRGELELDVAVPERDVKHHEALPAFRVGAFVNTLRTRVEYGPAMRLALEWHIISATRPGEACGADWSEFDWANDCWVIPAERMKMRRAHRVPLTARHHAILDLILGGKDAPAVGPVFSVSGKSPVSITGLRRAMQGVQAKDCTLHGFRSSFATWARSETYMVELPTGEQRRVRLYDEAMIEECLAHIVGGAVRNAYVRDDFLELRRPMLEAWATFCGKVPEASVVVPMRRRLQVAA